MTHQNNLIVVGQNIPDVTLQMKLEDGICAFSTADYFKGCRAVMFVVPGAFTPTCSAKHMPGFVDNAGKLKAAGIDKIACLAVNDAHVMRAWGEASNAIGVIDMMADIGSCLSDALGLTCDMGPVMGRRAARSSMVIEYGVVRMVFIEKPGAFEVSSAEHILANL